jgi:NTE family protein
VLASCALPTMFRAVQLGDDGVYWDGLFSQNPPIRDFMREFPDAAAKPDDRAEGRGQHGGHQDLR